LEQEQKKKQEKITAFLKKGEGAIGKSWRDTERRPRGKTSVVNFLGESPNLPIDVEAGQEERGEK